MAWFKSPYPLIEILWDDAAALDSGWLSPKELAKPEPQYVRSIGWLICETEEHLIYCCDVGPKGETNGRGQIPKKMIKEIKHITTRERRPSSPATTKSTKPLE